LVLALLEARAVAAVGPAAALANPDAIGVVGARRDRVAAAILQTGAAGRVHEDVR
jgi:hypothetical protein